MLGSTFTGAPGGKNLFAFHNLGGVIPASTIYYATPGISTITNAFVANSFPSAIQVVSFSLRMLTAQPASGDLSIHIFASLVDMGEIINIAAGEAATTKVWEGSLDIPYLSFTQIKFINNALANSCGINGFFLEIEK